LSIGHGTAEQRFRLKGNDGRYDVEAKKVNIGDEMCVLSLLQRYR
jgi:hypothetical protein